MKTSYYLFLFKEKKKLVFFVFQVKTIFVCKNEFFKYWVRKKLWAGTSTINKN